MRLAVMTLALVLVAAGCAGARVQISADHARYPLSLSPVVRDGAGHLYDARTLVKVGWLDVRQTATGFVYSAVAAPPALDFSDAINAQIAAAGGEAVVSLKISTGDGCGWLNGFPILNALPFWPGCVPLRLTGDIVRRRNISP